MSERRERRSEAEFIRRVLITIGIAALAAAVYRLSDVILLIFGSVLVAVVLRALARPIRLECRWASVWPSSPRHWS